ncbi:4Fe-4S dicluster domain-containing protein [Lysobacter sp. A3-1-A15]|uniref:4Fe-4S dicluster domain-containing protein n=1 Tax=Novilysobacter viscosus TaxID=3098602 RepID=UPI002ED9D1E7
MTRSIPLSVIGEEPTGPYVSESKIYPREVRGPLDRLRKLAVVWLLGMFYLFPWLRWDDRQAVLFDLPARKFHVFGLTFWPQDFLFLALLLIIAALALFFFTALAGRLWCGYACPQTVWTEVFLWMERWTEGDRNKRMKLDAAPWSARKLARKGAKHALWLVFALWTGFTFVGFFTPVTELWARAWPFQWGGWETFWVLFYALATWGNAGFLREQVCKYMCPYARFQSAMFDRNTLLIAYDPMRGEPRGPRKRGMPSVLQRARGLLDKLTAYDLVFRAAQHPTAADNRAQARGTITFDCEASEAAPLPRFSPDELGDCIDCTICVQVCPTGIDIRNGLQYECIACDACIDACNDVMDRMGYPHGLIRYATQNAIDGKPTRVLRPRIIFYGAALLALLVAWGWGVTHRDPLIAEVLRDRNALYREVAGGIENGYTLKLVNKTDQDEVYTVSIEAGSPGLVLQPLEPVRVPAQQVAELPLTVNGPAGARGRHDLQVVVQSQQGDAHADVATTWFGPLQ